MRDLQWMNMLAPWQWAIIGSLVPATILLYFLKLRREPLEVPSTYLWTRSIEDLHVNSIWQRLRKNILLLLQLLILALAALALLRPNWPGTRLVGDRFVFLIDNSASMQAKDVEDSRLAEAKRKAAALIEQMKSSDVAMIISFCDTSQVVQQFTSNRRELLAAVKRIEPTNRSTSLTQALTLAAGLANPGRAAFDIRDTQVAEAMPATVYLFSDGRFPEVTGFSLGALTPVYEPIGKESAENLAVGALSMDRSESTPDRMQAFVRIDSFSPEDTNAEVTLFVNGAELDAKSVQVPSRKSGSVAFDFNAIEEGTISAKLSSGGMLAVDDSATIAVNKPHPPSVLLVTPGNEALQFAIEEACHDAATLTQADPTILTTTEHQKQAAGRNFDLIIYDQCQPVTMPAANTLFVGQLPPGGAWKGETPLEGPAVIDVNNAHPLTQLMDLSNVRFATAVPLVPPPGATRLIETSQGTLYAIAPREFFEDAVLSAPIATMTDKGEVANTDWPIRQSFPVFALNLINYLAGTRANGGQSILPGESIPLKAPHGTEKLFVKTPSGKKIELGSANVSTLSFSHTDELGVYEVLSGDAVRERFSVNLFDAAESDLRPRVALQLGHQEVKAQSHWEGSRKELWKPLLWAGLAILLLEWYIYNRRIYI
jgi:hypothetical protein